MKKAFLLIAYLLSIQANAQVNRDSLWNIWNDEAQADTIRLDAIANISNKINLQSDPDSVFYYAQMHFDFAESLDDREEMAVASYRQGVSFFYQSEYPKAMEYITVSLGLAEDLDKKAGIASRLNLMGAIYMELWESTKALEYFQRSLKIRQEIGKDSDIAMVLSNIGNVYKTMDLIPKAVGYYERALAIAEKAEDINGIANTTGNLGIIYANIGDTAHALKYYRRSLKINEELGQLRSLGGTLINIGNVYSDMGKYNEALEYLERGIKQCEEIGEKHFRSNGLSAIGSCYANQNDYTNALDYYKRSLKLKEEIGDQLGIVSDKIRIGHSHFELGNIALAIKECQEGLLLAQEGGSLSLEKESFQYLYEIYKNMGNGDKALEYHEQMMQLDKTLNSEESAKALQQMEFAKQMFADSIAQVEADRLVVEAHQKEMRQKNRSRNLALGGGVLALLFAGGFYSRWRYVRKSRDIISKEKDRSDNLLLNILPAEIAAELKEKGKADARDFDMVSILFTDFKEFTQASEKLTAQELVSEINICFEAFDGIMGKYNIEKIKTIGDAYMAAGGLPVPTDDSVKNTILAALEMQEFISKRKAKMDAQNKPAFEMRVGIHTGPVVAGIVGVKKFQYDIWGDTVNTASRIESNGAAGKVNISQATYELLKDDASTSLRTSPKFTFESRGKIEAKGKGEIEMWFVSLH